MPFRHGATENLHRNYWNRNIYILSDNQAAIKTLDNYHINSKLVWYCHQSLIQLAKHNIVQLIWVPGHEGITGNKTVNQLAKLGSKRPFIRTWTSLQHLSRSYQESCQGLDKQRP
jgi:ribonuclease HI